MEINSHFLSDNDRRWFIIWVFRLVIPVPPKIEDSLSSGDKVRTEGSNVTLECTARGSPEPRITWRRQDGNNIDIDKSRNLSRKYRLLHLDFDAATFFYLSLDLEGSIRRFLGGCRLRRRSAQPIDPYERG